MLSLGWQGGKSPDLLADGRNKLRFRTLQLPPRTVLDRHSILSETSEYSTFEPVAIAWNRWF
jgi:hypothetical protein